jgi:hypothetical protein
MAKNSITDYDNLSSNNSDVQSVDISEGCSPSGINNAIREVMADLADVNDGTVALTSPKFDSIKDGNITPPDASGTDVAGTATTIKGGAGTGTGAGGSIVFQTADGGSTGSSVNAHATAMTITDDGNVGIGVASPARTLDISTTASTSPRVTGTSSNGAYLDFHNNAATTGRFRIGQGYASSTDNVGFLNNEANADMVFGTNNTQQVRIDSSGNKIFYGVGSSYNVEITDYGQLVGGIGAQTTSGTTNWNDVTNIRSGSGYTLLLGTATNGMGSGSYYHAFNFEYGTKDGTGNIAQWAIGYNTNARYMRYYYGGSWSSWVSF